MSTIVNTVNSPLIVWGEEIGKGGGETRGQEESNNYQCPMPHAPCPIYSKYNEELSLRVYVQLKRLWMRL